MAGSVRQIIEVPCTVEALERSEALSQLAPEALTALGAESIDGDALGVEAAARVDAAIEACLTAKASTSACAALRTARSWP